MKFSKRKRVKSVIYPRKKKDVKRLEACEISTSFVYFLPLARETEGFTHGGR